MSVYPAYRAVLLLSLSQLLVPAQSANEFFQRESFQEIRLQMLPADWQAIHDRYREDTFYPCSFAWSGYELPKIGIRSRGSQSRSPIKPSIGLDFSRYDSAQRFAGLKTLVMRNLNQDASMMHEFLAESLFARLGLPHSREAFARLYVNGEYAGVYLLVEPVDARFVKVRLSEDTGYLSDMQNLEFAYRFEYLGPDPALYVPRIFDPKTNAAAPDAEGLVEMIRQINEAHDNDFAATVNRYVDLNAAIAHAAAEIATSNWDGVLGINGMRNFYLYRWNATRRAVFLGWDMDGAFSSFDWPLFEQAEKNVLFRRALQLPEYRRRYLETVDAAAHAMADGNWLANEIEKAYALIRQAVYEDRFKLCRTDEGIGACTNEMFEAEVLHLRQFAELRPSFLWKALAAEFSHDPAAPDLRPTAAVTLSSELPVLAPGNLAALRTQISVSGPFHAAGFPLPDELAGVRLETESGPAPLIEVSPQGIVFVVPNTLAYGPRRIRVLQNSRGSNAIFVELRPTASVIFGVTHASGSLIAPESPAAEGEWIVLYATGVWAGQTPAAPLAVTIAGKQAKIVWSGAAPGFAGMQQLVVETPAGLGDSAAVRLVILMDGESGQPYSLPVRR